jgi:hypothetical protein
MQQVYPDETRLSVRIVSMTIAAIFLLATMLAVVSPQFSVPRKSEIDLSSRKADSRWRVKRGVTRLAVSLGAHPTCPGVPRRDLLFPYQSMIDTFNHRYAAATYFPNGN